MKISSHQRFHQIILVENYYLRKVQLEQLLKNLEEKDTALKIQINLEIERINALTPLLDINVVKPNFSIADKKPVLSNFFATQQVSNQVNHDSKQMLQQDEGLQFYLEIE